MIRKKTPQKEDVCITIFANKSSIKGHWEFFFFTTKKILQLSLQIWLQKKL